MKNYKTNRKSITMAKGSCFLVMCSLLLLAGCSNILTPPKQRPELKTPAGTGTFSLHIAGSSSNTPGRVIVPDSSKVEFVGYTLEFTNGSGTQGFYLSEADKANPIALEAGTYSLKVTAYTEFECDDYVCGTSGCTHVRKPAATGEPDGGSITIEAGQNNNTSITLQLIIKFPPSDDWKGIFKWKIGYPADLSVFKMEIIDQSNIVAETKYNFLDVLGPAPAAGIDEHELDLPCAHYRVTFTLEQNNTRSIKWRETLHIYQNLESFFEYDFTDYHFTKQSYTLTLTNLYELDGKTRAYDDVATYFWDDPLSIPDPDRPAWQFDGWFTDEFFTSGNEWDGTLTSDLTVYAKWVGYPDLSLSSDSIDFGSVKEGSSFPGEATVTISNSGTADADVSISLTSGGSSFTLTETPSVPIAANGGTGSIKIEPNSSLSAGTYTAEISISISGDPTPLTIDVTFTVLPKYSDTATANTTFNSNSLLNIPNPEYGWYAKEVQGTWRLGTMLQIGEDRVIDIPVTAVTYAFNRFQNERQDNGILDGGVGAWSWTCNTNGQPARVAITVDVFIPHDNIDIWLEEVGNPSNQIRKGNEAGYPELYSIYGGGSTDFTLKIKVDAYAAYEYHEQSVYYPNPYPIFEAGGIYYWQTINCEDSNCEIKGEDHIQDHWSIARQAITIIDFVPGAHEATTPPIEIRAYDPSESGVYFKPASPSYLIANGDEGLDINLPPVTPSHYYAAISYDLYIDGEKVGEASIKIVGHVQDPTTLVLSEVTLEVAYSLEPAFAPYVDSFTCDGFPVGSSNTVQITKNHGSITLDTEFTFF